MYEPAKHGRAEYGSWMQLPNATSITEGDESLPWEQQKFAQLVYNVAPTAVSAQISGMVDKVGILDTGTVKTCGDMLKTFVGGAQAFATVVKTSSTVDADYTWVLKAPPGTPRSASAWQAMQVAVSGDDTLVTWAEGSDAFTFPATDPSSLNYF